MKVFIIPGNAPNLNFALSEYGTVLKMFGDENVSAVADHYAHEYTVDIVENVANNPEVQRALWRNKLRSKLGTEQPQLARTELFRWQYGDLPLKKDKRKINVADALKKLAIGLATDQVTREDTALVMVFVASLLADQEEMTIE